MLVDSIIVLMVIIDLMSAKYLECQHLEKVFSIVQIVALIRQQCGGEMREECMFAMLVDYSSASMVLTGNHLF
jgi:hypothetical protein